MPQSNFNDEGLPIGQNNVNMTYLYGLADFFTVMFQDTSTVNLMLECTTQSASEIYSQFLQLTSTLSLENISETVGSAITLVLIDATDAVSGQANTYTLDETILSAKFIANKPLLPTTMLESGVDFGLTTAANGTTTITFAQPITSYAFSIRTLSTGVTQYAMWFVDAAIDERLLSKYYGNLIGVDPANSTDAFYSFVYGLYYVYVQGPTLDVITKGLNVTLGIPLARDAETVLDIRQYLTTNQYIVVTDQNSYLIPYGLPPSVAIGDTLAVGDELAQWVQVQDYLSNGDWWINLQIPPTIIPSLPDGQKDRYATAGSHFDYLMQNYLKKHTFLVNVNVANFENIQQFAQLSSIIDRAKPAYTQPIYVWTIDTLQEQMVLTDEAMISQVEPYRCEPMGLPIAEFYRGNTENPLMRSCALFMRYNVPYWVAQICGTDAYIDGDPTSMQLNGYSVTGFRNYVAQFRTNTDLEPPWIRAVLQRSSDSWTRTRSQIGWHRDIFSPTALDGVPGITDSSYDIPAGTRLVPLYLTTQTDIANKSTSIGVLPPEETQWWFPLFGASSGSKAINELAINGGSRQGGSQILVNNYNLLFFRDPTVGYLSVQIPEVTGWQTFAPAISEIETGDYLIGIRVLPNLIGVYWVTTNLTAPDVSPYYPVDASDTLNIQYDMPLTRIGGLNGTPWYQLRGAGLLNYTNIRAAINAGPINGSGTVSGVVLEQTYIDKYNATPVTITRGGVSLVHAIEQN